jgi:hypothetical protein
MLYKVVIGESASLARDEWYLTAKSLAAAAQKADKQRVAKGDYYNKGWKLVSVAEAGELKT